MSRANAGFAWRRLGVPWMKRGVARALDFAEPVIEWIIRICGWSAIIFVIAIFVFVLIEGAPALSQISLKEFFTSQYWRPTSQGREQYGILARMAGALSVRVVAVGLAGRSWVGCAGCLVGLLLRECEGQEQ